MSVLTADASRVAERWQPDFRVSSHNRKAWRREEPDDLARTIPRRPMFIVRLMVAGLIVAGGTLAARQQQVDQAQPTFRSKVDLIAVDVAVVDRDGRPVVALPP